MKRAILILGLLSLTTVAAAQEQSGEQLRNEGVQLLQQANTFTDVMAAEESVRKGVELLKQAAAKNDGTAQYILGSLALTQSLPPGTDVDPLDMFLKSARNGNEEALYGMCALAFQKVPIPPEDQEWLLKQLEEKAAAGGKDANALLAPVYFLFGKKDLFDARMAVLTQQADGGDAESQYLLGTILLDPAKLGFPQDAEKGLHYLEQAAASKHELAQLFLGEVYLSIDEHKDVDKGLKYLEAAAEGGNSDFQAHVGVTYFELGRSDEDFKKAFKYLSAAAAQNNRRAQFYLANMYQQGKGVEADPKKAEELFKESEKL